MRFSILDWKNRGAKGSSKHSQNKQPTTTFSPRSTAGNSTGNSISSSVPCYFLERNRLTDEVLSRALKDEGTDPWRSKGRLKVRSSLSKERGLCGNCARIDWRLLLTQDLTLPECIAAVDIPEQSRPRTNYERWVRVQLNLCSFNHIVENRTSCEFCGLIAKGAEGVTNATQSNKLGTAEYRYTSVLIGIFELERCVPFSRTSKCSPIPLKVELRDQTPVSGNNALLLSMGFWIADDVSKLAGDPFSTLVVENLGVEPAWTKEIDKDMLRCWVRNCQANHPNCEDGVPNSQIDSNSRQGFTFRVVDCNSKRVVISPPHCRYVALSYVWGRIPVYRSRIQDICCPGGDPSLEYVALEGRVLPRTIEDAMTVVTSIGERFLWVDSLCIIQDDEKELRHTISAMDEIYKNAVLTIVAASGTDANSGLSGVRPGSRDIQHCEGWIDGLRLHGWNQFEQDASIEHSPWSKRAWTYQERYFSRKMLIFANDRVYYKCLTGSMGELSCNRRGHFLNARTVDKNDEVSSDSLLNIFFPYAKHVQNFSQGELSYPEDVLRAYAGVASDMVRLSIPGTCRYLGRRVESMGSFYGLLVGTLALSLTWERRNMSIPLSRRLTGDESRPFLPSWTWTGWNGPVSYFVQKLSSMPSPLLDGMFDADVNSRISWPWAPGTEYQLVRGVDDETQEDAQMDSNIKKVLQTGILKFKAPTAVVEKSVLSQEVIMDNGTVWTAGTKRLVEIVFFPKKLGGGNSPRYFVLFVREEKEVCSREGSAWLCESDWKKIPFRMKKIRLG